MTEHLLKKRRNNKKERLKILRAAVAENQQITVQETEIPVLEGRGAIVKVLGCGLCGSDIVKFKNHPEPIVLGHEVVGEIVQIKNGLFPKFKKGDKIVLGHHIPCLKCRYCKNENYSMCREFKETNIHPGGFAEYICTAFQNDKCGLLIAKE